MAVEITAENFEAEVVKSDKPVLLDFWAVWCGPCQMLSPILESVEAQHPEVKIGKVNTDEQAALARQFGISAIPTMILFKDGQPVARNTGLVSEEEVVKFIAK